MHFEEKRALLSEIDERILLADGFEDALIGFVEIFNKLLLCMTAGSVWKL